jgi:hypothetical protein
LQDAKIRKDLAVLQIATELAASRTLEIKLVEDIRGVSLGRHFISIRINEIAVRDHRRLLLVEVTHLD